MEKKSNKFHQENTKRLIFAGIRWKLVNVFLIYDVDYEQSLFFL